MKFDHLAVAVEDFAGACERYAGLFGVPVPPATEVAGEKVRVAFFAAGESRLEVVAPTCESSPITGFLERRGAGLHHIAFAVGDIEAEIARLGALGFRFLGEAPRQGAHGHRVAFIHPASAGGVLVELVEEKR